MYTCIYVYVNLYTHRDLSIILRVALERNHSGIIFHSQNCFILFAIFLENRAVCAPFIIFPHYLFRALINTARRNKREDDSLGCIYRLDSYRDNSIICIFIAKSTQII